MKYTNTKQKKYTEWEDYFIKGTNTLDNIPGIKEKAELEKQERQKSAKRLVELYNKPIEGSFDYNHLLQIHKYLFSDIYPWAGEIRTVGMSKNNTDLCQPEHIKEYLNIILSKINETIKNINNKFELSNYIATLFYQLIYIHPFREGNGRTIREFIRQLIESLNFEFGSFNIEYENINDDILALCLTGGYGMTSLFLAPEFMKALTPKEPIIQKKIKKII